MTASCPSLPCHTCVYTRLSFCTSPSFVEVLSSPLGVHAFGSCSTPHHSARCKYQRPVDIPGQNKRGVSARHKKADLTRRRLPPLTLASVFYSRPLVLILLCESGYTRRWRGQDVCPCSARVSACPDARHGLPSPLPRTEPARRPRRRHRTDRNPGLGMTQHLQQSHSRSTTKQNASRKYLRGASDAPPRETCRT